MKDYYVPTSKELELMAGNLAERVIDVVYATARTKMLHAIKQAGYHKKVCLNDCDTISVNFEVQMVTGDFIQIIANNRRKSNAIHQASKKRTVRQND